MKPCTVDGCARPKAPGRGKKYCQPCSDTAHERHKTPGHCSIEGCGRPMQARGWCHTHYEHNRKYGTPHKRTMLDRFNEKVDRHGPIFEDRGQCWIWLSSGTKAGYGQMYDPAVDRHNYAHRISYEIHVGPIPEGLQIDHLCRRPSCVNPDHLEPVTAAENTRRAAAVVTHCPQGHAYDDENTYLSPSPGRGRRKCRACGRERAREALARQKESAA